MSLQLGSVLPNLVVDTTYGRLRLHDYQGNDWMLFFSHPADFTPVCTTELSKVVTLFPEFTRRHVKLIAFSVDNVESHKSWSKDIMAYSNQLGEPLPFPIISDPHRDIAVAFGMLDPNAKDNIGLAVTCRACFMFGPDKTLRLSTLYPASVGRNFNEIIRSIDALQLTSNKPVVTPADWNLGDRVILPENYPEENFPTAEYIKLPSEKPYMRFANAVTN